MHVYHASRARIAIANQNGGVDKVPLLILPFSVITFCVLTRGSLEALAHAYYFSYGQSRTTQPAPPCGHTTGEYFLLYKKVVNRGLLTCTPERACACVPKERTYWYMY